MSLVEWVFITIFAYAIGAQHGRIWQMHRDRQAIERRMEQMVNGPYRMPAPTPVLHRDQDAYGPLPPARNVVVPRMPCWWEMKMAYQRWRAPRPRTLEEMEAYYGV